MIQECRLPNGKEIFCLQKREVSFMYDEVQEYLEHGIQLTPTDVVFDVGANIGLFTLWLNEKYGKDLHVYAFEPIPEIFKTLSLNVSRHRLENVHLFQLGLSQINKEMEFAYYPSAPVISTAFPDGWKNELGDAMLHNPRKMPFLIRWLALLPTSLRRIAIQFMFEFLRAEPVQCTVKSLSHVIRENGIDQIDLLKIDVEKSELDVLLGIEEADWCKIKQIVIEIHNVNERVDLIQKLLKEKGFSRIVVDTSPILTSSNIVSLYSSR